MFIRRVQILHSIRNKSVVKTPSPNIEVFICIILVLVLCRSDPMVVKIKHYYRMHIDQSLLHDMTGFAMRIIWQVPHMEQKLPTLPITRSLVLFVWFLDVLSICFGHCVVCPSSIYELWLPLWYLQTLLSSPPIFSGVRATRSLVFSV